MLLAAGDYPPEELDSANQFQGLYMPKLFKSNDKLLVEKMSKHHRSATLKKIVEAIKLDFSGDSHMFLLIKYFLRIFLMIFRSYLERYHENVGTILGMVLST